MFFSCKMAEFENFMRCENIEVLLQPKAHHLWKTALCWSVRRISLHVAHTRLTKYTENTLVIFVSNLNVLFEIIICVFLTYISEENSHLS